MYIEHPACRHSKPASTKTLSSPSSSASRLTAAEPGTTRRGPSKPCADVDLVDEVEIDVEECRLTG